MTFAVGDMVHVASLGKGIVREVRNGGRFLVEVKGRALVVPVSRLTVAVERTKRAKTRTPPPGPLQPDDRDRASGSVSIDLHGLTAAEAIAALEACLSEAMIAGHATVHVIHGRSGGRLKAAVHGRLKTISSVRGFSLDPSNPGVTLVRL